MITLYNRINPFNSLKSKIKTSLSKTGENITFSGNTGNLEIEDRIKKDFDDLRKFMMTKAVENAIKDEFGKDMPYLASQVNKRLSTVPNTVRIA